MSEQLEAKSRSRFACVVAVVVGFVAMGPQEGCLPQRVEVSPDGKTMYFSLNDEGGFQNEESSNIYALDIENGRLKALTDDPSGETWCVLTPNGDDLMFMREGEQMTVQWLDLDEDESVALTGVLQPHAFPWMIPGESPLCLMLRQRMADPDEGSEWALYDGKMGAIPLDLPEKHEAIWPNVGTAPNRFAIVVGAKPAKDQEDDAPKEIAVFVVDVVPHPAGEAEEKGEKKPPQTKVTRAATWKIKEGEDVPMVFPTFSADGKRLIVALWYEHPDPTRTRFYEVDPSGKAEPRHLFDDASCAFDPEWTPGGDALVYSRTCAKNDDWREVVLRPLKDGKTVVLARLPGGPYRGASRLRWSDDGTLRIYHVSNDGVRIVTTRADGTKASAERLSRDKLKVQRHLADLERMLERLDDLRPAEVPAALKPIDAQLGKLEDLEKHFEAAWDKVDDWEEAPAKPDVPAPAPKPEGEEVKKP